MSKKNCLVLGATGQDGSFLCKSLFEDGLNVFGTSRQNIETCTNHRKLNIQNKVRFYQIKLSNYNNVYINRKLEY